MSREELLKQYKRDVEHIRKCAKELGISDEEITNSFIESFKLLKREVASSNSSVNNAQNIYTVLKILIICFFFIFTIYVLINVHQPTSSIVLRNVQGLIHPGFKILRFFSVPIIKAFPSLTNLYDESCLVENPYFYVSDMECWPCESVHSVIDLTGYMNYSMYQSGMPYIVKTDQKEVTIKGLKSLYLYNKQTFIKEANRIVSTNTTINDLVDLFELEHDFKSSTTHISWRINKMVPGRIIRSLFQRPYIISEWSGQSIERFVFIDGPKAAAYTLPNTECSYIFLIQGSGQRTIILRPSSECSTSCKTVSVNLKPSYVLWYNWWYWRPISLPTENSTETSISYINSYC